MKKSLNRTKLIGGLLLPVFFSQITLAEHQKRTDYQDIGAYLAAPYEWDEQAREEQRKNIEELTKSLKRPEGMNIFKPAKINSVKQDKAAQIKNMALMLNSQGI